MGDPTLPIFLGAIDCPEDQIDLAWAALLIAKGEYPDLDVAKYIAQLDAMASEIRRTLPASRSARQGVESLNAFLFGQYHFRGSNADAYYDPRNSFLNEVLDRKQGIPITLSVLYMELGRRIGVPFLGVGMPGHFVVTPLSAQGRWFVDPFTEGTVLTVEDCAKKLQGLAQWQVDFRPEYLAPVGTRYILFRMLGNLKGIYLGRRDYDRALAAIDRMLAVYPDVPEIRRDRGLVLARIERPAQAIADLERYLALQPDATDAETVKETISTLWQRRAGLP